MTKNKGFTLLELLVVIALTGIFAVVVIASLTSTRGRGRIASVQTSLSAVRSAANTCMTAGTALNSPATPGTTLVCTGDIGIWNVLPSSWSYAVTGSADCHDGGGTTDLDLTTIDGVFKICAYSSSDAKNVSCTEVGCTTSTYQ